MRYNQSNEHPEVNELKNICDISKNNSVCGAMVENAEAKKLEKLKDDKELDERLEETFPASDSTAHY